MKYINNMDEVKKKQFINAFVEFAVNSCIVNDSEEILTKSKEYGEVSVVDISFNIRLVDDNYSKTQIKSSEWVELFRESFNEYKKSIKLNKMQLKK